MTNPTLTPMATLLAEEDEETAWLVDGLLPSGGLSLILGKPKAGKSTLVRGLCKSVAVGGKWLERQCDAGPVVYLALEEKRAEVRRHFQNLGAVPDDPIYVYVDRLPIDTDPVAWLAKTIEAQSLDPVLIVIDPMARFIRIKDGGNDYMDATRQLEPLISYARDSKAQTHIALVHHSRKAAGEHGDESLGSTAILGSVDTGISLKREKGAAHRTIYSINRYGQDLEETIALLDEESGWVTLGGTKAAADAKDLGDHIIAFVTRREGPVTRQEIMIGVQGKAQAVGNMLKKLCEEGWLGRAGTGRKGDPFRYSIPDSQHI